MAEQQARIPIEEIFDKKTIRRLEFEKWRAQKHPEERVGSEEAPVFSDPPQQSKIPYAGEFFEKYRRTKGGKQ